jgi:hypothetical protein
LDVCRGRGGNARAPKCPADVATKVVRQYGERRGVLKQMRRLWLSKRGQRPSISLRKDGPRSTDADASGRCNKAK